jgi:hypothetical protein
MDSTTHPVDGIGLGDTTLPSFHNTHTAMSFIQTDNSNTHSPTDSYMMSAER